MTVEDLYTKYYYSAPLNPRLISGEEQASPAETAPKLAALSNIGESPLIPAPTQEKPALGELIPNLRSEFTKGTGDEFAQLVMKHGYSREEAESLFVRMVEVTGELAYDPEGLVVWVT